MTKEFAIKNVKEEWDDNKIQSITITIDHLDNAKTFIFRRTTEGLIDKKVKMKHYNMSMEAENYNGKYVWSEEEIDTIHDVYCLAKQTAQERVELDDAL